MTVQFLPLLSTLFSLLTHTKIYLISPVPSDGRIPTEIFMQLREWEACLSVYVVRLFSYVYFKGFNEKHQESGKPLVEQIIF